MKCKICGTRLKDGTTQCPTCGAVVDNEEATANIANVGALKRMTCPTCGKEVIGEHRRCPFCKDYLMRNDFGDAAKPQVASAQSQQTASRKSKSDLQDKMPGAATSPQATQPQKTIKAQPVQSTFW